MTDGTSQTGTRLPVPPNFPVTWENDEERLLWRWDDIHSPLPATPMSVSVGELTTALGGAQASKELRRHGRGHRKRINGYSYSANLPPELTPEQQREQQRAMEEAIASARQRWDEEFRPAIERNLAHMRSRDLDSATDAELLAYLDEFLELHRRHWYIHMMVVFPMHTAAEQMAAMYREIMGDVPDEEPYRLLQGIDNKSLETDRALQALTDEARRRPEVARLFTAEHSPDMMLRGLSNSEQGREFLEHLQRFLSVYGYRPTGFDLIFPSWVEDPTFVVLNVKNYLANPPRDLDREKVEVSRESEGLLRRVLNRLGDSPEQRERFLKAYRHARQLWPLKEDHAFYIDQGSSATVRILIAHAGRRLAQKGILDAPEEVFYLTVDEMKAVLRGEETDGIRQAIDTRRAERERFMKVVPPRFLGTLPPDGTAAPASEFQRMVGPVSVMDADRDPGVLRGVPGSGGAKTGPARIVRSPHEFGKVRPGDVLVCTSTSPTWTPLFGSICALVSDSGGALSHTAIVAREYKLPAVVGVKSGTTSISDGQLVTVDGDRGIVVLH